MTCRLPLYGTEKAICSRPNYETECQQSVNDFWSCKFGNWSETGSFKCILKISAALIGPKESDTLCAQSWKWASTEHQQFLPVHHYWLQCDVAVKDSIESCNQLYRRKHSGLLHFSFQNELNCNCPGGCLENIACLSAYKCCQFPVYRCLRSFAN